MFIPLYQPVFSQLSTSETLREVSTSAASEKWRKKTRSPSHLLQGNEHWKTWIHYAQVLGEKLSV